MNKEEVRNAIKEIIESHSDALERLDDVRRDIERNGGFSYEEKGKLLDLRLEFNEIAYSIGKLLGVA